MYFLIDIVAVAFVLGLALYGLKIGFFKSTVDVALVIAFFAVACGIAFGAVYLLEANFGWVTEMQSAIVNILGNSKLEGGQEIVSLVAYYLSYGLLILVFLVGALILTNWLRKLIVKLFEKINKFVIFGFFDKLLGFTVNLAFSAGLVICILALVYALAPKGIFVYSNEVFLASEVLSLVYEVNPLNALFETLFATLPPLV